MNPLIERARKFLSRRAYAYRQTFSNPNGEKVLKDLHGFCRATDSTFHTDPRVSAVMEGRREVWLRIQRHLNLSEEQLWAFHKIDGDNNE